MGTYWWPANMTKREYVDSHDLDCGLKWAEWNSACADDDADWDEPEHGSVYTPPRPDASGLTGVERAIIALIEAGQWSKTDDLRVYCDSGDEWHETIEPTLKNVSQRGAELARVRFAPGLEHRAEGSLMPIQPKEKICP